jgi:hypothetical protein
LRAEIHYRCNMMRERLRGGSPIRALDGLKDREMAPGRR